MSEEQMNDSKFGRLFIILILSMTVLAIVIMVLASAASSDVNSRLDERANIENSNPLQERIAPVGEFSAEANDAASAPIAAVAAPVLTGEEAYSGCAACHASGIAGAPMVGDKAAWTDRLAQGIDVLYDHAINGFKSMPSKGGNSALSDASVQAAVDYMAEKSR